MFEPARSWLGQVLAGSQQRGTGMGEGSIWLIPD